MARQTFLTGRDLMIIQAFLAGHENLSTSRDEAAVEIVSGKLTVELLRTERSTVAWFTHDCGLDANGFAMNYSRHVINAIMRELQPDGMSRRVEQSTASIERKGDVLADRRRLYIFHFDGAEIQQDVPFNLVGPVSVAAYRASLKP